MARAEGFRAHWDECKITVSSDVLAVLGQAALIHLFKCGVRLLGRRYEAEVLEEGEAGCVLPLVPHVGPHWTPLHFCSPQTPHPPCEEVHTTADHGRPVERFWEKRPPMPTRGGQVRELSGLTPLLGKCVPGEEGCPTGGGRVEVALPPTQAARCPAAAGRHAPKRPGVRQGRDGGGSVRRARAGGG